MTELLVTLRVFIAELFIIIFSVLSGAGSMITVGAIFWVILTAFGSIFRPGRAQWEKLFQAGLVLLVFGPAVRYVSVGTLKDIALATAEMIDPMIDIQENVITGAKRLMENVEKQIPDTGPLPTPIVAPTSLPSPTPIPQAQPPDPTPQTQATPVPAPVVGDEYIVKAGDTLRKIANRFPLLTWGDIARHNNISPPYTIHPGQRLTIPR